jgi:hypothetical protein
MKLIKRFIPVVVLFFASIMFFSCNLEDFNMNKLSKTNDIVPEVFAPLAYGTFKISDLAPVPVPLDNAQIPAGGIDLTPILLSKSGTTFSSTAIDSVYLITHFTNGTPGNMEFELSFVNASGVQLGQSFPSANIPAGAVDQKIQFPLGPIDQTNLQQATDIKLIFRIYSPNAASPITYGAVKSKPFTVKISFYAPVRLQY